MMTTCNKCGRDFSMRPQDIFNVRDEEYDITYFECPHCKERYLICTFDKKMHDMVARRRQLEYVIRIAREKKFRPGTIRKYIQEREAIIAEQKKHAEELKTIGEELMNKVGKGDESDVEEHNSDKSG